MSIVKSFVCFLLVLTLPRCKNNSIPAFNEVEHFSLDRNKNFSISEILNKKDSSDNDRILYNLVLGNTPDTISDTALFKKIEEYSFVKKQVQTGKLKELASILTPKNISGESTITDCIPVYRDILVFKQNFKTIAIIKICFDCKKQKIIIQKNETSQFEPIENFEGLQKLLYN